MRNLIVGIVVGLVVGVVVGTTLIAPRLKLPAGKSEWVRAAEQAAPEISRPLTPARVGVTAELEAGNARRLRWRMASAYASTLPQLGELGVRLETTLWHVSGGAMVLKLHEPSTLVAADEMFEAVRSGAIDAAFAAPALWGEKNSAFRLFSAIPFGPPIQEYLAWIFDGGGREMLREIAHKQGVHMLICGALAPEGSGWFRKPVKSMEDFKALRLGMNDLGGRVAAKLGARVTEMPIGDVFVALEHNLIDGAEASQPAVDLKLGLHQLAKYYYFPGWHQPATLLNLTINLEAWRALAKERRVQIEAACGDNVTHGLAVGEARQFSALKELIKQGVSIETWAPDILTALKAAWGRVVAEESRNTKL